VLRLTNIRLSGGSSPTPFKIVSANLSELTSGAHEIQIHLPKTSLGLTCASRCPGIDMHTNVNAKR